MDGIRQIPQSEMTAGPYGSPLCLVMRFAWSDFREAMITRNSLGRSRLGSPTPVLSG